MPPNCQFVLMNELHNYFALYYVKNSLKLVSLLYNGQKGSRVLYVYMQI